MVVSFSGGCLNVAAGMTTTLWLVLLTNMPLTTVAMRGMKMEHFETEVRHHYSNTATVKWAESLNVVLSFVS